MNAELGRRVAFTLGALLVFRIGTYIPIPGIDLGVWAKVFNDGGNVLGTLDIPSGGAIGRLALFALGITPYVSAAIILQIASFFIGRLRRLREAGDAGQNKLHRYTIVLTLLLATFQSYNIALALEGIGSLVANPGWSFRLATIATLAGGTMFLVWLADQITARGIGNGIALILCAGIVAQLPQTIAVAMDLNRQSGLSTNALAVLTILLVALTAVAVLIEKARRSEPVVFRAGRSQLTFKLNAAGVIPAVVASLVLALLVVLATLADIDVATPTGARWFDPGQPLFLLGYAIAIFLCVYLYTALVLDPSGAAEKLQRYGGSIPQAAPGEATADHLDGILSRITLIGAVYFVLICLIPELLLYRLNVPLYLGGTSLLVLVCTVIDIEKQVRALARIQ